MTKPDQPDSRNLVVILGDQLSPEMSSLKAADKTTDIVLMCEVADETTYVGHHKKKIAFVLSAMRHFAIELEDLGWTVDFVKLDDENNTGSLVSEIERALDRHGCRSVLVTEPGEWRLREAFEACAAAYDGNFSILDDDRFLCSRSDFAEWADGRKQLRMENFYREMRRSTGLLMDGDDPVDGRWNFDAENRKPPEDGMDFPTPHQVAPDDTTESVIAMVEDSFADHFGTLAPFWFAVTRKDAEAAFDRFIETGLVDFGDYQDAMLSDEKFLFHAVVSLYLNVGLLDPRAVCRRVEAAFHDGDVPLNAAEGFIRQIIGWREYVRGIYWRQGPDYVEENFFGHTRPLPDFYWTGETDMACLRACVEQTRSDAYAHHIQRLMVTGNFAMLAGIDPRAVHEWYLAVYADAYEWVELPNTLGMSQFADGGLLASKPYAASGNYINRMSDYCGECRYKISKKTGDDACPFNYLYWDFLARNREKLDGNTRLARPYATWDRFEPDRQQAFQRSAEQFLETL
jgi:deoxyribodipyrimidine photolyase-related protein